MTEIVMRRVGNTLVPVAEIFEEELQKLPEDIDLLMKASRPRSLPQHRLFFSLLSKVAKATQYETADRLLIVLKLALGYADSIRMPSGKHVPVARSISFASMPQDGFRIFFDDALDMMSREILPEVKDDDLVRQIYSILDGSDSSSNIVAIRE